MKKAKTKAKVTGGITSLNWVFSAFIAFLLGFFVSGHNMIYGLSMTLMSLVLGIFAFIGIIPFVGLIIYLAVSHYWLIPTMLEFMSVEYTWVVTAILVYHSLIGVIITLLAMYYLIRKILR